MVSFARIVLLVLGASQLGEALAPPKPCAKCTTISKRREWLKMPDADKKAYITAEQCLFKSTQKLNKLPGAKTRWDEFASLHQIMALQIHSTGTFLPFHRYFLHVHELLLAECGYTGGLPWWDEAKDAGKFSAAKVFNTTLGFGGSGQGANNCVPDGPYAGLTVNIGKGFATQPRCVNRKITDSFKAETDQAAVTKAISGKNYDEAWLAIYMGPHLYGHIALAMMDGDSITSAGDPLFMLHHGFVDKMWWDWQKKDLTKRLTDITGPNAMDPKVGFIEFGGGVEEQSKMWGKPTAAMLALTPDPAAGDKGVNTTLSHILSSFGIIPDTTVKEIMDIQGGYLCYDTRAIIMPMIPDPNAKPGAKLRSSCDNCAGAKVKCGREGPTCTRCKLLSLSCHYGASRRNGKKVRKPLTSTPHRIEKRTHDDAHIREGAQSSSFEPARNNTTPMRTGPTAINITDNILPPNDFEENGLATNYYSSLPFDQFGAWPLGGLGMDNFFPVPEATAGTTTSVTENIHSCPRDSYEIFRDLICPSPFLHAPESNSSTVSAPLDQVLQFNKAAISRLTKVLKCPCSRSGHRAMVHASIVSRILIWYQQAAGLASISASVSRPDALTSSHSSFSQESSTDCECEPLSLSQTTGFTVDHFPLSYGAFEVDDENMQAAFRNQLVLSELKKVAGLIETFTSQELAEGGSALYLHLGTWLQVAIAGGSGGIIWRSVDYHNASDLIEALRGVHTVLSFINQSVDHENFSQKALIDASIAAGVKRFAPSEYGSVSKVDLPFWEGKTKVAEYLKKVNKDEKVLEYTLFQPGMFLDYLASPAQTAKYVTPLDTFFDFQNRRAIVVEGYENAFMCFTTVRDIAQVVAEAIDLDEWPEIGGIQGNRVSISNVLEMGERIRGSVDKVRIEDLEAGILTSPWTLGKRHPSFTDDQAAALGVMLKTVLIGTLLSSAKGAYDVSDSVNHLLPNYKFMDMEQFLNEAWAGKP
ncbi:hypothetical protein VTL71DRAFT_12240 [Oculimacula yallundae]|uniref:Zn(2)-C6 fungal-type domain-containing protein n=1 Tax=Oculimacula yallundae TaxID=86028 RepID=A0ABR4CSW7_9HELO